MPLEGSAEDSAEWLKLEKYDEERLKLHLNWSRGSFVDTGGFPGGLQEAVPWPKGNTLKIRTHSRNKSKAYAELR